MILYGNIFIINVTIYFRTHYFTYFFVDFLTSGYLYFRLQTMWFTPAWKWQNNIAHLCFNKWKIITIFYCTIICHLKIIYNHAKVKIYSYDLARLEFFLYEYTNVKSRWLLNTQGWLSKLKGNNTVRKRFWCRLPSIVCLHSYYVIIDEHSYSLIIDLPVEDW